MCNFFHYYYHVQNKNQIVFFLYFYLLKCLFIIIIIYILFLFCMYSNPCELKLVNLKSNFSIFYQKPGSHHPNAVLHIIQCFTFKKYIFALLIFFKEKNVRIKTLQITCSFYNQIENSTTVFYYDWYGWFVFSNISS